MKNTKKTKYKSLKNYNDIVKKYVLIDNKSNYDIEYRYIEKDFEFRLLSLYIKLKNLLSIDIINIIFKHIIKLNYDKYLVLHYECLCLINSKNYQKIPIYRRGFEGVLDMYTGENIGYETRFSPKCNACSKGKRCQFLDCKFYVLNSNYCRLHMNCKCGYNRRLESCKTKHV